MKNNWSEEEAAEGNKKFVPIAQGDKDQIKMKIVDLMCSVPQNEQKQLSDSLSTISKYDFPQLWPNLLQELFAHGMGVRKRSSTGDGDSSKKTKKPRK